MVEEGSESPPSIKGFNMTIEELKIFTNLLNCMVKLEKNKLKFTFWEFFDIYFKKIYLVQISFNDNEAFHIVTHYDGTDHKLCKIIETIEQYKEDRETMSSDFAKLRLMARQSIA